MWCCFSISALVSWIGLNVGVIALLLVRSRSASADNATISTMQPKDVPLCPEVALAAKFETDHQEGKTVTRDGGITIGYFA